MSRRTGCGNLLRSARDDPIHVTGRGVATPAIYTIIRIVVYDVNIAWCRAGAGPGPVNDVSRRSTS
jgi:hypothetical protein